MPKFKILAFIALIAFALNIAVVDDGLAGERFKTRTVYYTVKCEPIEVSDEEGHVMSAAEYKGIVSNMEGRAFGDGWVVRGVSSYDRSVKTKTGSGHSYMEATDRDGDKCYCRSDIIGYQGNRRKALVLGSEIDHPQRNRQI